MLPKYVVFFSPKSAEFALNLFYNAMDWFYNFLNFIFRNYYMIGNYNRSNIVVLAIGYISFIKKDTLTKYFIFN